METVIVVLVYGLIVFGFLFSTWMSQLNYNNRNATIPNEVSDIYEEKEYKRWLMYTMENFRFNSIIRVVNTVVFLVLLIFGVFLLFDDISKSLMDNVRVQGLIFIGLYFLVDFLIGIYPSYYQTFVIEEKYGFNKTTKKTFITDKIKSFVLTVIFGGGIVYLLMVINDVMGDAFLYVSWGVLMAILFVVQILYTSVIVPLFNKITPLEDGELKEAIHAFANSVGYEVSKISVMDASKRSSKLNAFFSGFGKFKKIVLYDTLVEKMSTEEIVAVLAHEIGHSKHKHIVSNMIQTGVVFLIYIGVFTLVLRNEVFATAFGFDSVNFGFSLIVFTVLISPLSYIIGFVMNHISRKNEYQADAFAATKYNKEPMVSALKVLGRENFANLTPHPTYVMMNYSHPPLVDRIRAINNI